MPRKQDLTELDQAISQLQSNLFDLYKQRQSLFSGQTDYPAALRAATTVPSASADAYYEQLAREWSAREVSIPTRRSLLKKIKAGLTVIEQLATALNVSSELFRLVLIPPTGRYNAYELAHDRLMQPHIRYADQYDAPAPRTTQKKWKLLAVYDGLDGIDFGSAADMLATGSYMINGLDCSALGPREYAIYALHHMGKRDTDWVWLLKQHKGQVWSVRHMGGAYHFTLDDARGLGQGEYFRPAVEIM